MGARPASIHQADITRVVRAMKAAGLPIVRVVIREDRVILETSGDAALPITVEPSNLPDDDDRPVVL